MKKIFGLLILMIISTCFFACKKATISYVDSYIEIYENETFSIDTEKIVNEKEHELNIYSLDESIVTISDNVVTPVTVGESAIRIEAVDNNKVFCDISIKVLKGKVAQSVSLESSTIRIDMGENKTALNKITINSDATETPQISYDSNIIKYDYSSGVITALAEGKTIVNIEFIRCKTSFEVFVSNTIYTQVLEVQNSEVFANSEGKLDFECFPANANTYRFWSNSQDITIFRDGTYTSKDKCTAIVYCQYFIEKNRQSEVKTFKVTVVDRVIDMSISIEKMSGGEPSVYAVGINYKLIIRPEQTYTQNNFTFSNNIDLVSDLHNEGGYIYVFFQFKDEGDQTIRVTMTETRGNIENVITKTKDISVVANVEVNICAKWSAYILNPGNDGKYRIFLNGEGSVANSIEFCAELGGDVLEGDIMVYQFINDTQKIEVNKEFIPSITGEFTFEIYYEGENLGQVCVIVDEM